MGRLIIDGNSVYEIDEDCICKKEGRKKEKEEKTSKEKTEQKNSHR